MCFLNFLKLINLVEKICYDIFFSLFSRLIFLFPFLDVYVYVCVCVCHSVYHLIGGKTLNKLKSDKIKCFSHFSLICRKDFFASILFFYSICSFSPISSRHLDRDYNTYTHIHSCLYVTYHVDRLPNIN